MISKKVSSKMGEVSSFHVMEVMARAKTLEEQGRDIVHMEVGEPDFPTPKTIIDAGIEFLNKGDVHYTKAQGLTALRYKIAEFYQRQYGVFLSAERIFITPGASGALTVALATLLDQGDEVLIADASYPCNSNLITLFGGNPMAVNAPSANNFQLDAGIVADAWGVDTRGVLMASPSNPTGTMIDRQHMDELVQLISRRQGFLISDEIYHGLTYEEPAVSALEFSEDVFVLNSFSKFFGMTGWRLGWLVVPEYAVVPTNRLMQNLYISAPTHSQYAALAAFNDNTQRILLQRRDEFKRRRDILYEGLIELGFVIDGKPQGAFYIYADCSALTDNSHAFVLELLEKGCVATTPGIDFGQNEPERYIRFAYTTSVEQIELGLERIKGFLGA